MGIIGGLEKYMKANQAQITTQLDHLCGLGSEQMTGVRTINGGRYELFFAEADNRHTFAVTWLLNETKEWMSNWPFSIWTVRDMKVSIIEPLESGM